MGFDVPEALARTQRRIADLELRYGREPGSVKLLAVSKTKPPEMVRAAFEAGQTAFGENHLQDAEVKLGALADLPIEWHFIGALQSNKTRRIAERFAWVHGVDRARIARRLSEQRSEEAAPLELCIQVNVSGESSKAGVTPEDAAALADAVAALPRVRLRGLMAIPAPAVDIGAQRAPFRQLRELLEALNARGHALDTLSMGMSADIEAAIAEGSTIVRIGTAVFGARPTVPAPGPG